MKSKRAIVFVILLVAIVGAGGFFAGFWLGQQTVNGPNAAGDGRLITAGTDTQVGFEKIIQHANEQVYDDERQRSDLTDDEARPVLDWAAQWIRREVSAAVDEAAAQDLAQRALGRVRSVINTIRGLRGSGQPVGK